MISFVHIWALHFLWLMPIDLQVIGLFLPGVLNEGDISKTFIDLTTWSLNPTRLFFSFYFPPNSYCSFPVQQFIILSMA